MSGRWDGVHKGIYSHPFLDLEAMADDEEELDEEMEDELGKFDSESSYF